MTESLIATLPSLASKLRVRMTFKFCKSIDTLSTGLRETPFRMKVEVEDVDNDELTLTVAKGPQYGIATLTNKLCIFLNPDLREWKKSFSNYPTEKQLFKTLSISIARHETNYYTFQR